MRTKLTTNAIFLGFDGKSLYLIAKIEHSLCTIDEEHKI